MDRIIMGANWYVDSLNQMLRLEKIQLPELERDSESFAPGGGFFQIDIPYEIQALEAPFSLNGSHADVRSLFGREPGDWTNFYYYERLRDIRDGKNLGRVVMLRGLIGSVKQAEVKGKKADMTDYKVTSIVHYHDVLDGKTVHKMDFFTNTLIIDTVDYSAPINRLLGAAAA